MKKLDSNRPETAAIQQLAKELMTLMIYSWDQDPGKTEDEYWDEVLEAANKIALHFEHDADLFQVAKKLLVGYLKGLEEHQRTAQMITAGEQINREAGAA